MKFKHITLFLGLFIFLIGIIGYGNLYSQSKININEVDKQYLTSVQISTIGNKTVEKIIKNQPYENMEEVNVINGIGTVKYNTLSKIFCTYDTCRFEYYILFGVLIIILCIAGVLLMTLYYYSKQKEHIEQKEKDDKQKQLSNELKNTLEKNIKK